MSTKVYRAYRLKEDVRLFEFTADVKNIAINNIQEIVKDLYRFWMSEPEAFFERFRKYLPEDYHILIDDKSEVRPLDCSTYFTWHFKEQVAKYDENFFNLDVSIAFREYEGRYYLIPYAGGMVRDVLKFLDEDPRIEDYSYWDNSDKPKEVTEEDWAEREAVWEHLCQVSIWPNYLALDICNHQNWWLVDPWMALTQEIIAKKKADNEQQ